MKKLGKNAMMVIYFLAFILVVVALEKLFGGEGKEGLINSNLIIWMAVIVFLDRTREDLMEYLNGRKKE